MKPVPARQQRAAHNARKANGRAAHAAMLNKYRKRLRVPTRPLTFSQALHASLAIGFSRHNRLREL